MSLSQFLPIRDNLKLVFRLVMRGQIGVWTGHHFADNCDVQTIQVHRLRIIQIPNSPGFSTTPFVLVSITKWSMMETLTMRRKKKKYSLSTEATDTTTRWWKRHAILQFRGLLMDLLQTSICFPFFFSLSKVQNPQQINYLRSIHSLPDRDLRKWIFFPSIHNSRIASDPNLLVIASSTTLPEPKPG